MGLKAPPAAAAALLVVMLLAACSRDERTPGQDAARPSPASPVTATLGRTGSTTAPPEAIAWLKAKAIPFTTSKPGSGSADLQPLKAMIGDARIVSLGEATHGTREFFEMKHRLLEFLVTEMGFNTFAIEASWPEANLVNDYVMTGEGDPKQLLSGLHFWTWNTEEVLDMIVWMRKHNESPGNAPKVSFYGFDMQFPGMAIQNVLDYLGLVDPAAQSIAEARYACFLMPQQEYTSAYAAMPPIQKQTCRSQLGLVTQGLAANQATYEAGSSRQAFARALQSASIVIQGERLYGSSAAGDISIRDSAMAANVSWLLEQAGPGARIVLWAHNGHVAEKPASMGGLLRAKYGDQLVIIGFDFYQGSFQAVGFQGAGTPLPGGPREFAVQEQTQDSYEAYFHSAGLSRFFLNLGSLPSGPEAQKWFSARHSFRSIGCCFYPDRPEIHAYETRLQDEFDVVIYFDMTSAAVPVR